MLFFFLQRTPLKRPNARIGVSSPKSFDGALRRADGSLHWAGERARLLDRGIQRTPLNSKEYFFFLKLIALKRPNACVGVYSLELTSGQVLTAVVRKRRAVAHL